MVEVVAEFGSIYQLYLLAFNLVLLKRRYPTGCPSDVEIMRTVGSTDAEPGVLI